jgi:hypothetical protein
MVLLPLCANQSQEKSMIFPGSASAIFYLVKLIRGHHRVTKHCENPAGWRYPIVHHGLLRVRACCEPLKAVRMNHKVLPANLGREQSARSVPDDARETTPCTTTLAIADRLA